MSVRVKQMLSLKIDKLIIDHMPARPLCVMSHMQQQQQCQNIRLSYAAPQQCRNITLDQLSAPRSPPKIVATERQQIVLPKNREHLTLEDNATTEVFPVTPIKSLRIMPDPINTNVDKVAKLFTIPTDFNGKPVVRDPKELGLKAINYGKPIIHPSGLRLYSSRKGYVILCIEDGCKGIGSKEGIKCVKHSEHFNKCRHPECGKKPHYGHERRKPLFCAGHREPGMIDVVHNICGDQNCNLLAYFGLPGGRAEFCSNHKSPDMIDVLHKRCIFPGCDTIPTYGLEGERISYCSQHKPASAVISKSKLCIFPGCQVTASFCFEGGKREYCTAHKSNGMINPFEFKCSADGCMIRPTYGYEGFTADRCSKHKEPNMIDVKNKRCLIPGCITYPCFGFKDGPNDYCNSHKLEGMINVKSVKCKHDNCGIQARYGFRDGIAEYCAEHKDDGMINLKDKRCCHESCEVRPSYGLLFSKSRKHCRQHATLNEYGYDKLKPCCTYSGCINPAHYIDPQDVNVYPIRCNDHKIPTDVELVKRECPNCLESLYYPANQQHCMNCGKYREQTLYHFKETIVKYVLQSNGMTFIHDKSIVGGKSRFRPDFVIPSNFGRIIVEVDEHQHTRHEYCDELNRMRTIYHDIQCVAPGQQVLFIRYNPDIFNGPHKVEKKQRLDYLCTVINSLKDLSSLGANLGFIKLFYDGFAGSPNIEALGTIIDMVVHDETYDDNDEYEDDDLDIIDEENRENQ